MKKIAFIFAVFVAVSFMSCGNKTDNTTVNDSDSLYHDSILEDTTVDTTTIVADTVNAPEV